MASLTTDRISSLRLLKSICRTGQLTAAAQLLGLSPSGASHLLNDLRKDFKDPLFERTGLGLAPTTKMTQLLPRVEAVLSAIDDLTDEDAFDPSGVSGDFRIVTFDNALMVFLLSVIPRIKAEAPKLNIIVGFVPGEKELVDKLRSGEVNLALHPRPPRRNDVVVHELPALSYVLLTRAGHPLASLVKERPLSEEDLLRYVQIAPGNRPSFETPRPWEKLKRRGAETIVQPYFNTSPFLLLKTDYYEWVPKVTAAHWVEFERFAALEPPESLKISFAPYLFWSRRANLNPLNQWIRSLIIDSAPRH